MFDDVPEKYKKHLVWDTVSTYSSTDYETCREIIQHIKSLGSVCIDANACVGSMTRFLCSAFLHVIAIEIDSTRAHYLAHNMNILNIENVHVIHGDACIECKNLTSDVIIFDPPWGGKTYKQKDQVSLFLNETPLHVLCDSLVDQTKYIVVKVPTNFAEGEFLECIVHWVIHKKVQLRRMNLLILKKCF